MPNWVDDDDVPVLLAAEIAEVVELFWRLHHCGAITITPIGEPVSADGHTGPPPPERMIVALTSPGVFDTRESLLGTGCAAPHRDGVNCMHDAVIAALRFSRRPGHDGSNEASPDRPIHPDPGWTPPARL